MIALPRLLGSAQMTHMSVHTCRKYHFPLALDKFLDMCNRSIKIAKYFVPRLYFAAKTIKKLQNLHSYFLSGVVSIVFYRQKKTFLSGLVTFPRFLIDRYPQIIVPVKPKNFQILIAPFTQMPTEGNSRQMNYINYS